MTSWASIAKRNISIAEPVKHGENPSSPDKYAAIIAELCDTYNKQAQATLEQEEQSQCRPTHIRLKRPDAPPTVSPIFGTREEKFQWMHGEVIKNEAYSKELFERRMHEWRVRNNWQLPQMKTAVSKDDQIR